MEMLKEQHKHPEQIKLIFLDRLNPLFHNVNNWLADTK